MATTVEVLAAAFKDAGTPFIVGHPGGELVELMEAARQRQMRFLLMKQEVAGAMLASTWGDLTGSPGICLSTRGPGATNMVNGVAHAFLDRSPLIAITDSYSRPTYEIGTAPAHQPARDLRADRQMEHDRSTPRWCASRCAAPCARRPATPPGPVHFEISAERDHARGRRLHRRAAARRRTRSRPARIAPTSSRRSICSARRGGRSCSRGSASIGAGASAEFVQFAERLGAPVLTTTKCKGMIPEDHPLRAGCIIGGLIERKLVMEST